MRDSGAGANRGWQARGGRAFKEDWTTMLLGTQLRVRDDDDYRVWAQLGVTHVRADPPGNPHHWSLDDLLRLRGHVARFGL